jgi:hypothetical protein
MFDTDKLEHFQRRACIIVTGDIRLTKNETLLQEVSIETLKSRRRHHRLVYLYKIMSKGFLDVLTSSVLFKAFLKQVTEIADDATDGRLFQSCIVAGKNEL